MSIKDRAVRWFAARWLAKRISEWRKDSGVMGKLAAGLDGNKRLIVVLGFIASGFTALLTGQDVSAWLDLALRAFGWTDPATISEAKTLSTQVVPLLFAIWAAGSALWHMWRQHKAGATVSEINSPAGVVKAAIADGSLVVENNLPTTDPAVLTLDGVPIVAKVGTETVRP